MFAFLALLAAAVCFLLVVVGFKSKINLTALGFLFITIFFMIVHTPGLRIGP